MSMKTRLSVLSVLVVLTGCGGEPPHCDYITRHGVCVELEPGVVLTATEVEDSVDQWIAAAVDAGKASYRWTAEQLAEAINGLYLHVFPDFIFCAESPSRQCWGLYNVGTGDITLVYYKPLNPNFCSTFLWHELIHLALRQLAGDRSSSLDAHKNALFKHFHAYTCIPTQPAE